METISYRGTTINKIENTFWYPGQTIGEDFSEDFIYVSNGFLSAVNDGKEPIEMISVLEKTKSGEWHHLFSKENDGSFSAKYVRFN